LRIRSDTQPDSLTLRTVRFVKTPKDTRSDPVGHLVKRTWPIDIPEDVKRDDQLDDLARHVIAEQLDTFASASSPPVQQFYSYSEHQLRARSGSENQRFTDNDIDQQEWLEDAMTQMTGRQAIDETLQANLQLRTGDNNQPASTPISDVESLNLPDHPWSKLLKQVHSNGDAPGAAEPIANLAPSDRMYARFDSLEAFIRLLKQAGPSLAPMLGSFANAQHLDRLVDRYESQLGIDASLFAEQFGDLAVNDVALLLDDPYLASGTAVSIIFKTDTPSVVNAFLNKQLDDARSDLDASDATRTRRGRDVRFVESDNHRLSHIRLTLDNAVVVSNSPAPINAILATVDGESPSVADAGGFQFMRHFYPAQESRTGLLFIGEDFVKRFTSPQYRIAQARRSRARAALHAPHYHAMYRSWLDGEWPDSPDAVFQHVERNTFTSHADGSTIHFDLQHGTHSAWGTTQWMRPISEIDIDKVTEAEQLAYEDFRQRYENLGFTYGDPIGLAFTQRNGRTTFDLRVTPLHQRSEYRDLAELVGDTHLYNGPDTDGIQWTFGIGEDSDLRRTSRRAVSRAMFGEQITLDWLGSWGAAGIAHRSGIWDGAILFDSIPVRGSDPMRLDAMTQKKADALDRLPAWIAFEVRSQLGFTAFVGGIRQFLSEVGPNFISWSSDESHRDTDITRVEINLDRSGSHSVSLHYTVTDGVFVASLDRATLEHRIDAVKAGYTPRPSPNLTQSDDGNSQSPDNSDTKKTADAGGTTEQVHPPNGPQTAGSIRIDHDNSWVLQTLFGLIDNAQTYGLAEVASANRAAHHIWPSLSPRPLAEQAQSWWGVNLHNHHGRLPSIGNHGGIVDPLYGILPTFIGWGDVPPLHRFAELPVEQSPVTTWLDGLRTFKAEASLEQHGDALGLHTRVTLEWTSSKK
jgi:hypothetical protein